MKIAIPLEHDRKSLHNNHKLCIADVYALRMLKTLRFRAVMMANAMPSNETT